MVLVGFEYTTRNLPTTYAKIGALSENKKDKIEIMFLGSSQIQGGINIKYIDIPAINFASGSQHHREDFAIFKQTKDRYPELKYVVFELSYAHLEIPHNDKTFWKNAVYLKYYGVNAYERNTYFKDKLIYISNPDLFSRQLYNFYISKPVKNQFTLNEYGFNELNDTGSFKVLNYDTSKIKKNNFSIRTKELPETFKYNTFFFENMIEEATSSGLKVIIATIPTYTTYNNARNPNILRRRDSVLNKVKQTYKNVSIFNLEDDTINFKVTDFKNENHLNPKGAEKLTKMFNIFLKQEVLDD
ncbi:hypothetical protein ULMS_26750 [Patiriisocius marinistellae]|uniref:SGNH/GDSL hydrolase family protein n=1 Tax=Patiriisocius marinistellae TaxID=2494560 RepID=A0A5J4FWS3_9FLAO|nr:hypothetical protein ULMS_26750 [Patiriisocius marinistellae]